MARNACTEFRVLTNVHLNTTDGDQLRIGYELLAAGWQTVM